MAIEVRRAVTIDKPVAELYGFWRELENLPRIMSHLQSVTENGDRRSHWVAKGPAGSTIEWDAELTEDRPDELIAWRSLPEAEVPNRGEVRFVAAPADRGTEIHVRMSYDPPAGAVGAAVASLFGEAPDQQVREDLRRFKRVMETDEVPTTDGQPAGPSKTRTDESRTDESRQGG